MERLTKIKDDGSNVLAQYAYDKLSRRTLVLHCKEKSGVRLDDV